MPSSSNSLAEELASQSRAKTHLSTIRLWVPVFYLLRTRCWEGSAWAAPGTPFPSSLHQAVSQGLGLGVSPKTGACGARIPAGHREGRDR